MKKNIMSFPVISMAAALSACGGQNIPVAETVTAEAVTTEAVAEEIMPIQLNYAQGISDHIYGWTLSEDGSYYMLSAIKEDGTPMESSAEQNFMNGGRTGNAAGDERKTENSLAMFRPHILRFMQMAALHLQMQRSMVIPLRRHPLCFKTAMAGGGPAHLRRLSMQTVW